MNHVTHKTALALKSAGFLPVHADLWQAWYDDQPEFDDESPEPFFIAGLTSSGYSIARANEFSKKRHIGGCVFAPTAIDILATMPGRTLVRHWFTNNWHVDDISEHENPAEAAAMAWLALNKKI